MGAPDHGASREKTGFRCVLPIRKLSRRAGERGRRAFPHKGDGNTRLPANEAHPYPDTPPASTARGKRGPLQTASHSSRISRRTFGARPSPAFRAFSNPFAPVKDHLFALPAASSPAIPQGERRALPAPAQESRPLRIPLGEAAPISPSPIPQNCRRRTAPARGPSAVYALCRRNRNETQHPSPLLMGLGRVNPSQRHWPAALPCTGAKHR